ncbi:DUF6268 family outer membrane beta-barrel protein [Zobellia laminariae]|uniref:DUF6268 family outer membrane beta-barrel protein n=1 Tax=Zobellia laminariae TaxID=248906 RepID=UPI0012D93E92|nr:DUF6268 family outer membrane beta-barrel protein [Zobellia laminariae]MUH38617.1 hypothetical protein [Zobellia laminariae]WKX74878.1 DUF6268 family outer membrane beta-barrel protein [Zobellia laminariae]
MRHITFKLLVVLLLGIGNCSAQLSDLAKIDYTRLPKGDSEVGYDRLRGVFNYPIKVNDGSYFLVGMDYSKIELSFDESVTNFDITAIEDFQLLDINLGYTYKMKGDWRFGARFSTGYSSNLVRKLSVEDAVFSGDVVFINDKRKDSTVSKPYRLIIGVSYAENRGIPFPIPFISYYRKFHQNWSYKLGVPKMNLQYHLSEKSRFKLVAELDGFTANIQDGILVNEDEIAHTANMSIIIAGLRYEYKFTKHLELYFNVSNILRSNAKLKDNDNNTVNSVRKNNIYYLRTGVRFKI